MNKLVRTFAGYVIVMLLAMLLPEPYNSTIRTIVFIHYAISTCSHLWAGYRKKRRSKSYYKPWWKVW